MQSTSIINPNISIDQTHTVIQIELKSTQIPFEKYQGTYSYQSLPFEFKVIFQNIQEFYTFVLNNAQEKLEIKNGNLHFSVQILGKKKQFLLPLQLSELTPEEALQKKVYQLENALQGQKKELLELRSTLAIREEEKVEKEKVIEMMTQLLKERETQNKRLAARLRANEEREVDEYLVEEEKGGKEEIQHRLQQPRTEPSLNGDLVPLRKNPAKVRKLRQLQRFGSKLSLKVDPTCRYYSKFKLSSSSLTPQIQKLHGPTYQLFAFQPLPRTGKHYFDIRIQLIKNNNIVIGLITQKNKQSQFSFKQMNCICYNGYDGSICVQDRQKYVNVKPREGNKIRTVVDMDNNLVLWFIMGGEKNGLLVGNTEIPPSILKMDLFPYFELYWEGNKVRLNN